MRDLLRGRFMRHYLDALLWSSLGVDGEPIGDNYSVDDVADDAIQLIRYDIASFLWQDRKIIRANRHLPFMTDEAIAHDIALTRNRHGAGFWDRGHERFRATLTEKAHELGSQDLYVGDDGRLHI